MVCVTCLRGPFAHRGFDVPDRRASSAGVPAESEAGSADSYLSRTGSFSGPAWFPGPKGNSGSGNQLCRCGFSTASRPSSSDTSTIVFDRKADILLSIVRVVRSDAVGSVPLQLSFACTPEQTAVCPSGRLVRRGRARDAQLS